MCAQPREPIVPLTRREKDLLELRKRCMATEVMLELYQKISENQISEINENLKNNMHNAAIENLKKLTVGQFENYLQLLNVFEDYPDWLNSYSLLEFANKKRSYRSVISKNFLHDSGTRNTRGNPAFSNLLRRSYQEIETRKKTKHGYTKFKRNFVVYKPTGFLENLCKLIQTWSSARMAIAAHFMILMDKINIEEKAIKKIFKKDFPDKKLKDLPIRKVKLYDEEIEVQLAKIESIFKNFFMETKIVRGIHAGELISYLYKEEKIDSMKLVQTIHDSSEIMNKWILIFLNESKNMNKNLSQIIDEGLRIQASLAVPTYDDFYRGVRREFGKDYFLTDLNKDVDKFYSYLLQN